MTIRDFVGIVSVLAITGFVAAMLIVAAIREACANEERFERCHPGGGSRHGRRHGRRQGRR